MHICPLPHCRVKVPGGQDVIIHLSAPVIIHTWHCNTYIVLIPITQLCPTLCDPVDCNPPASSVHGILQARILECAAIVLSLGDLPNPGIEPWYPAFPSPRIRKWQPTPYSCLGESHGQRNLAGYSPWDRKELDMTEQHSLTHSLTHSCIAARFFTIWATRMQWGKENNCSRSGIINKQTGKQNLEILYFVSRDIVVSISVMTDSLWPLWTAAQ